MENSIDSTNTSNQQDSQLKPENYLIWSILATILCCLPLGIPAIIYASMTNSYWQTGHYNEANQASKKAKLWTIISAVTGIAGMLIYLILLLICVIVGVEISDLY